MVSVFLSHSFIDKPIVRELARILESYGVKVWLDEAEIDIGDSLTEKIGKGILDDTEFVAAVLSGNSINSMWVQKELQLAMQKELNLRRVVVLPILIEPVEIPPFLTDKLYADFTTEENFSLNFPKLLRALGVTVEPSINHRSATFVSIENVRDEWAAIQRVAYHLNSNLPALMDYCYVSHIEDDCLVLYVENDTLRVKLAAPRTRLALEKALYHVFKQRMYVKVVVEESLTNSGIELATISDDNETNVAYSNVEMTPLPRWLVVYYRRSGDDERDRQRIRRMYSILTSNPGEDRFSIVVEGYKQALPMEFPNHTVNFSDDLIQDLIRVAGENNISIFERPL